MKAVPADTLRGQPPRYCEARGHLGLRVMEGRVEARDLWQRGVKFRYGCDRGKMMRLMQRCEWNEPPKLVDHRRINPNR